MSFDFFTSLKISETGLQAQAGRMRVISENIANANSTAMNSDTEPYRRKMVTFRSVYDREVGANVVALGKIAYDPTPFGTRYEPGHPYADKDGYVKIPNVSPIVEVTDMNEAQRAYRANINAITVTRSMVQATLQMLA